VGGPIVRSGPSPEFSKNWENIFGKPSATASQGSKPKKKAAKKKKKGG